jgi:hypothetical protein
MEMGKVAFWNPRELANGPEYRQSAQRLGNTGIAGLHKNGARKP